MNITIEKLPSPEHHGDWHDAPVRWIVKGPGTEAQKFSTKAEARLFKRCRKQCTNQATAISCFISLP